MCFSCLKAFANPEDIRPEKRESSQRNTSDPDVDRVRRNHFLKDIENIVPFVSIGFCYIAGNPDLLVALWHFLLRTPLPYICLPSKIG